MKQKTSTKKNFFYQAFYEILIIITPLVVSPYLSRVLGVENIGKYSFAYSIAYYFVLVASLGIKNYGNREIAKVRDEQTKLNIIFSSLFYLHFFISLIVVILYYVYTLVMLPSNMKIYSAIMGLYVVSSVFDISWLFFGLEQFKITVTRNTIIKILSTILIFVLVKEKDDLGVYIFIFSFSNLLNQLYLWIHLKGKIKFVKVSYTNIKSHLPQMFLLFIPTIAISLYNYMDKIMVGVICSDEQLGLYDNAEKIIFTASQFMGAVGTVMLPKMSNIVEKSDNKLIEKYINISIQIVLCMSFAFMGGIMGVSKIFPAIFWGNEFLACSQLLFLLAIALPFKGYANVLRTQFLIPKRCDKVYTLSVCLGALINLILNFYLIRLYGATGAVVSTIAAESIVCIYQAIYCKKFLPVLKYMSYCIPFIIMALIMAGIVYTIGIIADISTITLIIQIIVGVLFYSAVCYLYFKKTNNKGILNIINPIIKKIPILNRFM